MHAIFENPPVEVASDAAVEVEKSAVAVENVAAVVVENLRLVFLATNTRSILFVVVVSAVVYYDVSLICALEMPSGYLTGI